MLNLPDSAVYGFARQDLLNLEPNITNLVVFNRRENEIRVYTLIYEYQALSPEFYKVVKKDSAILENPAAGQGLYSETV